MPPAAAGAAGAAGADAAGALPLAVSTLSLRKAAAVAEAARRGNYGWRSRQPSLRAGAGGAERPPNRRSHRPRRALAQATTALNQAQQAARGGRAAAPPWQPLAAAARGSQTRLAADFSTVQRIDGLLAPPVHGSTTCSSRRSLPAQLRHVRGHQGQGRKGRAAAAGLARRQRKITLDNTARRDHAADHAQRRGPRGGQPIARLKDTYVLIGAHLDHVGYARRARGRGSAHRRLPPPRPRRTGGGRRRRKDRAAANRRGRPRRAGERGSRRRARGSGAVRRARRHQPTAPTTTDRDRRR